MKRILNEVPVASLNERTRLREHRLRLDIARHSLRIKSEDVFIGGRENARLPECADDLLPINARVIAEILRRRERSAFGDRLGVVDYARARFSREDFKSSRLRHRSTSSHMPIVRDERFRP